ncbi:hypothetical protein HEP_00325500 [Hepatocystis sp. ex Piliocolobus tephrosceles]|nr:hypothetical protein HEP_00325500 [Hepatocystis sp. ex Piliocolobus tephrosceles]
MRGLTVGNDDNHVDVIKENVNKKYCRCYIFKHCLNVYICSLLIAVITTISVVILFVLAITIAKYAKAPLKYIYSLPIE